MTLSTTLLALALSLAAAPDNGGGSYKVLRSYQVGNDGGWDYLTVDSAARKLYVSHATRVEVLDLDSGKKAGEIPDTPGVHGIALVPELKRGFVSNGKANTVTAFETTTLKPVAQIPAGKNPDAIIYDPASKRIFVSNGTSQDVTAIDAATMKVAGTIPAGGRPEFAVADGKGHVFLNVEDKSLMLQIDSRTLKVLNTWKVAPCEEPASLALDAANQRLFAGCRNKMMAVVDAVSGKVITTLPVGDHVDATVFDGKNKLVFNSNGDGTISVIRQEGADKYSLLQTVTTQRGAKTAAMDPKTGLLFLPVADYSAASAGSKPAMVPNSFKILVVGK
jgi:YVTN family beta-propeller protein